MVLRSLIRLDRQRRRVWIMGQRLHHGPVGVALVALGTLLAVHDRRDVRDWFRPGP